MRRICAFLLCLTLTSPAWAADFPQISRARALLHDAQTALNRAKVKGKRDQLAAIGQAVRAHEAALAVLRTGLRQMALENQSLVIGLEQDRAQLAELLGALQSVSRAPQSALLVFPGGPVDAARAAILMAEITPQLDAKAAAVKARVAEISALRSQQDSARVEARGALASLQDLRVRTAQILRSRTKTIDSAELSEQARAAGRQAKSLNELAAVLQSTLGTRQPTPRFAERQGTLSWPVHGIVAQKYGAADAGRRRFGLTLSAPAFAHVAAPVDATVRYVGPLIGYGNVVVLEPEDGWMIVLSGLSKIDRLIGEAVLAGEKLGDLGGPLPTSEEFLMAADNGDGQIASETLYIEVRKGSASVDPLIWFAGQN